MSIEKKAASLFEKKKGEKPSNLSHIEQVVGSALNEIVTALEGENKRIASFIILNRVLEVPVSKGVNAILIYFSYRSHKVLLTPVFKKVVNEL